MRAYIFLFCVIGALSLSFFASADNSGGGPLKKPVAQSAHEPPASHCLKKILLPDSTETACLIQKRKGRP